MGEKIFYQCFSGKQKTYLEDNGNKMILKCKHFETNKTMWIFLINDKLSEDLIMWSKNK